VPSQPWGEAVAKEEVIRGGSYELGTETKNKPLHAPLGVEKTSFEVDPLEKKNWRGTVELCQVFLFQKECRVHANKAMSWDGC